MSDLLRIAATWMASKLKAHASTTVVYRRGAAQVSIQATLGRTLFALDQQVTGVPIEYSDRDYLISAADLVLAGNPTQPADEDEIHETVGLQTHVYKLLAPGDEPVWRWSDPHRQIFRIHTKFDRTF